jgi:hypothetical protein
MMHFSTWDTLGLQLLAISSDMFMLVQIRTGCRYLLSNVVVVFFCEMFFISFNQVLLSFHNIRQTKERVK